MSVVEDLVRELGTERVIVPDDSRFPTTKQCWNGLIDRRPLCIVQVTSEEDIQTCIRLSNASQAKMTVRGGGHSMSGMAVADDSVMLDLSQYNKVEVDAEARRIRVQGGGLWHEVDSQGQPHNLSVPCGAISHTGVGGLTLGGGMGWLSRKHGLSCDCLRSARVVTADHQVLQVSESENADLFWAIRGGGGNFGVVSQFEFECFEVPPVSKISLIAFALEVVPQVLEMYTRLSHTISEECTMYILITPGELIIAAVDLGATGTLTGHLEECRSWPSLHYWKDIDIPLAGINQFFDEANKHGNSYYCSRSTYIQPRSTQADPSPKQESELFSELWSQAFQPVLEASKEQGVAMAVEIVQMGGQISRVQPDQTAFFHRRANYEFHLLWNNPPGSVESSVYQTLSALYRSLLDRINFSEDGACLHGGYVNISIDEDSKEESPAYGSNFERLRTIKSLYDSHNFFSANHNIPPAQ